MSGFAACRLRVRGIVQGVGFRPHAWRLARELGIKGWVRNDADGVAIAVAGPESAIACFIERLSSEAPPLARIDRIERCDEVVDDVTPGGADFRILDSQAGAVSTAIGPDAAVCLACLGELFDPAARRYRYAFTTCTHCGPRYTIARGLPYDRVNISLARFPLCAACATEYADPADRRFHAEATCCPACGPKLALHGIDGTPIDGDPVAVTLDRLVRGDIVAIKGLGGFHLACAARDPAAVARLRARKAREAKPFAVMAVSPQVLAPLVEIRGDELALLRSPAAPVVLLDKTAACDVALPGVAPGVGALGVMLPNTPLQWLLFHEAAGRPAGIDWIAQAPPDLVLVMTSANPQGEPLVIDDDEAFARLAGIADAVLGHDREIVARADDSVIRVGAAPTLAGETRADAAEADAAGPPGGAAAIDPGTARPGAPLFIRRGRGYTPQLIRLPHAGPSVLAFGGWFKNTVCLTRGDEAFVSTHVGDLDTAAACRFLDETVDRMLALTEIEPQLVAHDRHPDFYSTRAALRFAAERGLPTQAVQHHHAHLAAVAADHGITAPVLGLALDGVGLGDDSDGSGSAWGGELLRLDGAGYTRLGHLPPLALPGGDRAAREPWRMGAAALFALGRSGEIGSRYVDQPAAPTLVQMLSRRLNCPKTSSAGRLFDAAAGLLGVCPVARFEAQAAMELEALAERYGPCAAQAGGWRVEAGKLDLAPLLGALADESDPARGAALFHATFAAALADWVAAAIHEDGGVPASGGHAPTTTRLLGAGGCWLNRRLVAELAPRLAASGLTLCQATQVPPGDGGLSLGQAWVAILSARKS